MIFPKSKTPMTNDVPVINFFGAAMGFREHVTVSIHPTSFTRGTAWMMLRFDRITNNGE